MVFSMIMKKTSDPTPFNDDTSVPKLEEALSDDGTEISTIPGCGGLVEGECELLYGPYPNATPVPHKDANGTVTKNKNKKKLEKKDKKDRKSSSNIPSAPSFDATLIAPDHRDVGTPDEWVPRDGNLVRLTGRHPFNVEPPLRVHQQHQFLTPSSQHYVRNHSACPKIEWNDHRVSIGGDTDVVSNPIVLTMNDIVNMPPDTHRELPVTLVCAGNRRKEQNMIRQTIGFNWGAAGVSTNVWRGVMLRDVLIKAGVSPSLNAADLRGKHVEFIGVEDLPNKVGAGPFVDKGVTWGKLVKYGTSIPLSRAMNPSYDVILAFMANGELLQPDHGYPVRLIIPGFIGGRMIKWLAEINVIKHETYNHYHYHDNRILPPHITAEESNTDQWWYRPEYIFNELNINSAITKPDHHEILPVSPDMITKTYPVEGYAYTGGGRMITRVEITVDGGVHWELATIKRTEQPTEHDMNWCWVRWSYDVKVVDLFATKEIWCRAWDESNMCQPVNPTWNLMGMGNNQVFRTKVHIIQNDSGGNSFKFEHPTLAGQQEGGWMTTVHGKPESAGFGKLLEALEQEEEKKSEDVPKPVAKALPKALPSPPKERIDEKTGRKVALDLRKKVAFRLQEKIVLSRDSYLLDFALQSPDHILGLPTGKHVFVSAKIDGDLVMRRYTPISCDYDYGCIKFVIKAYRPCERFPAGGKMSQHLDTLKIGDTIDIKGPIGEFEYFGKGKFKIDHGGKLGSHEATAKCFNMIAGGTGITPCMQVAADILRHHTDNTKVSLIFAARIEEDLLLRKSLDEWAKHFKKKFKIHYILSDDVPDGWKYSKGFCNQKLFEDHLYPPGDGVYNVMCGPPIMIERGCTPNLTTIGHKESHIFAF